MGWRGRDQTSPWPGRGPFSNLPPWERPGWLNGRGACWYLYRPQRTMPPIEPKDEVALLTQQKAALEEQLKTMQETLEKIQDRLNEIEK